MKFLIDRCAGRRLAAWLIGQGHDVVGAWERHPDPGDQALLEWAAAEKRVMVTIDTDFGDLIFFRRKQHCGLIRLPDVPAAARIDLLEQVLQRHTAALEVGAVVTVRGGRIRVSRPSS